MSRKAIILKEGREKPLWSHHPWIFSGAIKSFPHSFVNGDICPVFSSREELLGYGYFNKNNSLSGRMISFGDKEPMEALRANLDNALLLRKKLFDDKRTNAYRLVNAEGDGLPGLVIDKYGDYLVVQVGTLGMERLKETILKWIMEKLPVKGIYERSDSTSRREEKLEPINSTIFGEVDDPVEVMEEDLRFLVSLKEGQKTGFFLDQREMRKEVGRIANNQRVLNAFGYTGAFSLYALKGGAAHVDTVDSSKEALALAEKNLILNQLPQERAQFIADDLFFFLNRCESTYDLIILDPPAFAKRKEDLHSALKGYREINRLAMGRLESGGLLLTASCSYHVDELTFQRTVLRAACEARREVKLLGRHRLAFDHPIALGHPEGSYLKSLLLQVI